MPHLAPEFEKTLTIVVILINKEIYYQIAFLLEGKQHIANLLKRDLATRDQ